VLPALNLVDTLAMNTPVDLVGYGVQNFVNGGGPCGGPCKKQAGDAFTRFFAPTTLIQSSNSISGEFIKLHSNAGGTCFGDSGGPNFLGAGSSETNIVAATTITGDSMCRATNVDYRLDTAAARSFLGQYVALP
jgi:hypothetical protein